ncbi:hypothetical protein AAMO2058_000542800 [Amorphochlora amoebiformis]
MDSLAPKSELRHIPLADIENAPEPAPVQAQPVAVGYPTVQAPVVAQPVDPNAPPGYAAPGSRRPWWKSGICDCCMQCSPSCLMGFFCPCFQFANIKRAEGIDQCIEGQQYSINCCLYFMFSFFSSWSPDGFITFFVFLIGTIGRTYMLTSLRIHYRLRKAYEGSQLEDVLCSLCCAPCTLSQMARDSYPYERGCECDNCGDEFGCGDRWQNNGHEAA